jgi:hypothetical protein
MADGWTWPEQMNVAGFSVVQIHGSTNDDGSGTATGALQLRGVSTAIPVSLVRTPAGVVSGTFEVSLRLAGAEIQGDGALNSAGFRIAGGVLGSVKPIADAVVSVNADGRFQGSGRVSLNALSVPVSFNISSAGFAVRGSVPVEVSCDTRLALYRFKGSLELDGGARRLVLTASGTVERRGKLADQVTTHKVSGVPVNVSDGTGPADIAGVVVPFNFF